MSLRACEEIGDTKCDGGSIFVCDDNAWSLHKPCDSGVCENLLTCNPEVIPCVEQPTELVCGLDGNTYNNTCFMTAANIQIDPDVEGACDDGVDLNLILIIAAALVLLLLLLSPNKKGRTRYYR